MSNVKISELTETTTLNDNDELVVVQNYVTKKVTAKNAINGKITNEQSESEEKAYSCAYLNDKITDLQNIIGGKQYILVTIATNFTIGSGLKIPFDTVVANTTNGKLSLSNSNIVVGNGVSKVRISGAIFNEVHTVNNGQYTFATLKWRGVDLNNCIVPLVGNFITNTINPKIQSVSANDTIYLIGDCTGNSTARAGHANTYLLVEIVE